MIRVAIVGSSGKHWTPNTTTKAVRFIHYDIFRKLVDWDINIPMWKSITLISGGATGIDSYAEVVADALGIPKRIFKADHPSWNGIVGKRGYKQRNIMIAEDCDILYCIDTKDREWSGGRWTMTHAKELGKETRLKLI